METKYVRIYEVLAMLGKELEHTYVWEWECQRLVLVWYNQPIGSYIDQSPLCTHDQIQGAGYARLDLYAVDVVKIGTACLLHS